MNKKVKTIRSVQREIQQDRIRKYGPDHTRPLPQMDKRRKKSKYKEDFS
jgi:hypothetical protein